MSGGTLDFLFLISGAVGSCIAALFAILCFLATKRSTDGLTKEHVAQMLRVETDVTRAAVEAQARGLRQELSNSIKSFQEVTLTAFATLGTGMDTQIRTFGERLDGGIKAADERIVTISSMLKQNFEQTRLDANTNRETLRTLIEGRLDASATQQTESARILREELGGNFSNLGNKVSETLAGSSTIQKERLDGFSTTVVGLTEKLEKGQEALRASVESRLDVIRDESALKLEEMRKTVDEKLQTTLDQRLGESFNRVVEHLERVHKGIGEMQSLAANVGDLKNVLTNVKVRGTYGEVQLALLLEQFLSPDQYVKNATVTPGSSERVEFAIKFPADGDPVLLSIDSKFPREDYDHLQEAIAAGDATLIAKCQRDLTNRIKACAKDISSKYINPPHTLELAILFIPTESLYAEILRQPGLTEQLQRDYRVALAGPTNLAAILTSFQMGFRALALQKRSTEVWQILSAIKGEFQKYGDVVSSLSRQLTLASTSVEKLGTRARIMTQKLRNVEVLPDNKAAGELLGLSSDATMIPSEEDQPEEIQTPSLEFGK
jgi:DNA recombination protein RmuC